MSEESSIRVGERIIHVGGQPVIVYRTIDGRDWASTNQSNIYLESSEYKARKMIALWEQEGKLTRKVIKGKALYILLSDLDKIKEEIHSPH